LSKFSLQGIYCSERNRNWIVFSWASVRSGSNEPILISRSVHAYLSIYVWLFTHFLYLETKETAAIGRNVSRILQNFT